MTIPETKGVGRFAHSRPAGFTVVLCPSVLQAVIRESRLPLALRHQKLAPVMRQIPYWIWCHASSHQEGLRAAACTKALKALHLW